MNPLESLEPIPWLHLKEVAYYLGVDERTARRWYDAGDFPPPYVLGTRKLLWKIEDVDKWLQTKKMNQEK